MRNKTTTAVRTMQPLQQGKNFAIWHRQSKTKDTAATVNPVTTISNWGAKLSIIRRTAVTSAIPLSNTNLIFFFT
jgi:hypothetical protein